MLGNGCGKFLSRIDLKGFLFFTVKDSGTIAERAYFIMMVYFLMREGITTDVKSSQDQDISMAEELLT